MYVITAHQRYRRTDGRTSSDPMTATLLKHVAVKILATPLVQGDSKPSKPYLNYII